MGEYGADAVRRTLADEGLAPLPSRRTVGRILERRGALDARRRVRRPAPPPGWYLPEVARGQAELDAFDLVEGLALKGGPAFDVLTGLSLHGGLAYAAVLSPAARARAIAGGLEAHWREAGLPGFAQFDNAAVFQGPHGKKHPDVLSRVVRLCASLQVTPVFVPPREPGFQAALENFNGQWQAKVWQRFVFEDLAALEAQSARYVAAKRARAAPRVEAAPARRAFPARWRLDLQVFPAGCVYFVRRTGDGGHVRLLERTFLVDPHWTHRLVRCEVDLDRDELRCYALRRRAPEDQPLLARLPYRLLRRKKPFHE
ncbi:MAG: hypothetical protein RBU21_12280 [FCB group bacterium]|nr:hypothetical protein [FCB group bacterium]